MESHNAEELLCTNVPLNHEQKPGKEKRLCLQQWFKHRMEWCRGYKRAPFRSGKGFRMRSRRWEHGAFAHPSPRKHGPTSSRRRNSGQWPLHQEFANAGDHLCAVQLDIGHQGLMRETSHPVFQVEAGVRRPPVVLHPANVQKWSPEGEGF